MSPDQSPQGEEESQQAEMAHMLDRAWRYAWAADEMTHSRMSGLLIGQAFLVVGYFQIITADTYSAISNLSVVAIAVIVLALIITVVVAKSVKYVAQGCNALKLKYLAKMDDVYVEYLAGVRGQSPQEISDWANGVGKVRKNFFSPMSSYTEAVPALFLLFWIVALGFELFPWMHLTASIIVDGAN